MVSYGITTGAGVKGVETGGRNTNPRTARAKDRRVRVFGGVGKPELLGLRHREA